MDSCESKHARSLSNISSVIGYLTKTKGSVDKDVDEKVVSE